MVFLFILIILITVIIFSKIRVEITNFKIYVPKVNGRYLDDDFEIKIKLVVMNSIPILKLNITNEKLEKINFKNKFKNVNFKNKIGNNFNKVPLKEMKQLDLKIKSFSLSLNLGLDNTIVTSLVVPVISTVLALYLTKKEVKEPDFKIEPVYNKGGLINIDFKGIFEVKMIHIIKVIYIINKKRRVDKNERTSNRRAYGYSYE